MKKILESCSYCLWEHDGRYCLRDAARGEPPAAHCHRTEKEVIEWVVRYPLVTHFRDLDVAIIDYFGEDKVTMVMLEQLLEP